MLNKKIPNEPGVYIFKDNTGKEIYIGKAKDLSKRVKQYFSSNVAIKTRALMNHAADIEYFVVDNEVEALLLENKLIKKHSPKYNINLKDSKTYAYIALTKEDYPRMTVFRSKSKDMDLFGPYTDGTARFYTMRLAIEFFKLRTCRTLPKKACLRYHMGLCTAPCIMKNKIEYNAQVDAARKFLSGDHKEIVLRLENEMKQAAKDMKYEVSLLKKRQIESVSRLQNKQKIDVVSKNDQSVIVMVHSRENAFFIVLNIKKGVIEGKQEYSFEYTDTVFAEFLKSLYTIEFIPNEIIVSSAFWEDENERIALEEFFSKLKGVKVKIIFPMKGDKHALVELALKNAAIISDTNPALDEIKEKLNLEDVPSVIECFDISNLGREHIVAGMVRYVNGKPDKSSYRRFEIKSLKGKQDDFASIGEVVYQRYRRQRDEKLEMPNLIVIDGGLGQLGAAYNSLKGLGLTLPIISLAKREEEIYTLGSNVPLSMPRNSKMMLLLRGIRDATHDYVISYNRKKRSMNLKEKG